VVEVWQIFQDDVTSRVDEFRHLLSPEELQRADRYRYNKDRNQFTIARAWLRRLIGKYLGDDTASVRFQFSEKGKPSLPGPHANSLEFNVAHSGNVILLAFARGRRLGVDVEQIRTDFTTDEVAERFFSAAERRSLRNLAPAVRYEAFFRCWTRKEAYIKATGDGLSLGLDQFDVSLLEEEPAKLLATRPDPFEAERWTMHHLNVKPGYAAALVCERTMNLPLS
jgi:4'-phosphopantetheinyl transferase